MAKIDLKPLSLAELKALQGRVEKAIARHEKKAKTEALSSLRAQAKSLGFSLEDLLGAKSGAAKPKPKPKAGAKSAKKKAKAAPAYRDPKNAANTYGGRGPRPAWLKAALEGGAKLEDFKV
ncbi:MAG: H-NS histone family protein [Pseudomonadota bacterium]